MKFKTFLQGIQVGGLLALAAMLGGCATYYGPGSKNFETMSNHTVFALVRYVHPGPDDDFIGKYCALEGGNPGCFHRGDVDQISVAIGRDSWRIWLGGLLVPKSAHVQVGDIVVYKAPSDTVPYSRFVRVAARAADTERAHCGWVGSKILTSGGVVCDGWRYDKDYPLLAH